MVSAMTTASGNGGASGAADKRDIQAFWGALYDSVYEDVDSGLTRESLIDGIEALEDMFRLRRYMTVVEMPVDALEGKRVLEIGPGAGGHAALFAHRGAIVTAVDITESRARATEAKFRLLGADARGCRAMQGDAEALPFADDSFDIVYSNGVLHHTRDTEKAVDEAYRVLKPGGTAVIMLYCKSSWHYWIDLWLCVGIILGRSFGDPDWLGKATEWGGKDAQKVENPVTRCYTAGEARRLFRRFRDVSLRKGEFYFFSIPKLGKHYRRWQFRHYGGHPGGYLVYGQPWPITSPLERWLGPLIGFDWFIKATKPAQ